MLATSAFKRQNLRLLCARPLLLHLNL